MNADAKGCVFIGDELTAAGLRLAGVEVRVSVPKHQDQGNRSDPDDPGDEAAVARVRRWFDEVREAAELVLIDAHSAELLDADVLNAALREQQPRVLVIADIRGRARPPDLSATLKRQLGLAE